MLHGTQAAAGTALGAANGMADKSEGGPVTIKKYANRRLYNTATSSYVTLDHLCQMVKDGTEFTVHDAKSGDDITRSVLTQIIVEEEAKGQNLLPIGFLRQLISFYGDSMQWVVPRYLDMSMQALAANQKEMRQHMQDAFGGMFPFGQFDEMGKQNKAMFEQAMKMFNPLAAQGTGNGTPRPQNDAAEKPQTPAEPDNQLDSLKRQLDDLQRRLDELAPSTDR